MKPEHITVSLDMARKLKEAGWPQDEQTINHWRRKGDVYSIGGFATWCLAAPTAEEILRRLPKEWVYEDRQGARMVQLIIFTRKVGWRVEYNGALYNVGFNDKSLANAAAAMYCHLADLHLLP